MKSEFPWSARKRTRGWDGYFCAEELETIYRAVSAQIPSDAPDTADFVYKKSVLAKIETWQGLPPRSQRRSTE